MIITRCGWLKPSLLAVRFALATFAHFVGLSRYFSCKSILLQFLFKLRFLQVNVYLYRAHVCKFSKLTSICYIFANAKCAWVLNFAKIKLDLIIFAVGVFGSSYYRKSLAFRVRASSVGETALDHVSIKLFFIPQTFQARIDQFWDICVKVISLEFLIISWRPFTNHAADIVINTCFCSNCYPPKIQAQKCGLNWSEHFVAGSLGSSCRRTTGWGRRWSISIFLENTFES